jgi:hypothetical protein
VASIVAVSGLLVTLIFNTVGVWRAKEEAEGSRIATEVGLLTQVGAGMNRAEASLVEIGANDKSCKAVPPILKDPEEGALHSALSYYDYLAWLFNDEQVTLRSAKRYWGRNITEAYELAKALRGSREEVDQSYRELAKYARAASKEAKPRDLCPG